MLLIAVYAYLLVLLVYLILRAIVGERILFTTLLSYVYHLMLLPILLMLLLGVLNQLWGVSVFAGLHIMIGVILFRLYLPALPLSNQAEADDATAIPLTFLSYNLGNDKTNAGALVNMLLDVDADVVALQELTVTQADRLQADLIEQYPHQLLLGMGIPGIGLLSKYPFDSAEIRYLVSDQPYQYVVLNINGSQIGVYNLHPPPQLTEVRTATLGWASEDLALFVAETDVSQMPHIVIGDFNVTDQSHDYQKIIGMGLLDAYHQAGRGFGFTFPAQPGTTLPIIPPLYRIDYVFHTPDFRAADAYLGPDAGSDHRSLIAHLMWNSQAKNESSNATTPELGSLYAVEVAAK